MFIGTILATEYWVPLCYKYSSTDDIIIVIPKISMEARLGHLSTGNRSY